MIKKTILFLWLFSIIIQINGQPNFPQSGKVFTKTEVPKISIYINPDSLNYLYNNVNQDIQFHATFVLKSSELLDSIVDIGFGLRGNTSRVSQKKSFQISFNAFTQGANFEGLEKLNLNGEHNDPSIIRSKLSWDILHEFKCPGARANHVEVYINGLYYGLYINVEHIDEEFIASRFNNNDGNLYKCLYPADIDYKGANPDLYKFENNGHRTYELKINKEVDDYSDLARLIRIINKVTVSEMHLHLDSVFNTNDFLKTLCVDILTGDWDGYSFNKNNFYLYHNTQSGKFEYIPYDLDNTYGIDWFNIDWGTRNIYNWSNSEYRPLYTRILQNATYRKRFTYYMKQLLEKIFNSKYQFPIIEATKALIQVSAQNDMYRTLDYGWSISDFNSSYTTATGAHVKYGLKPYISVRYTNALSQLESTNTSPIISYVQSDAAHINQNIGIKAMVEDETINPNVTFKYRINSGNFESLQMYDDGLNNDGFGGDKYFGTSIPAVSSSSTIDYYIEATDSNSQTSREPVNGYYNILISDQIPELFINEFMAGNSNAFADEYGEFNDWIEIFNSGSSPIYLGDKYLSDNLASPRKWQMPNETIGPKQFMLFWADGDFATQGAMHTNFKLSTAGEQIGIFDSDANGNIQIDAITYGIQETDKSYGRFADGGSSWFIMTSPSPGSSNIYTGINILKYTKSPLVFPNPASSYFKIQMIDNKLKLSRLSIYNIYGQLVDLIKIDESNSLEYPIEGKKMSKGIYTLKIEAEQNSENLIILRKIIIL